MLGLCHQPLCPHPQSVHEAPHLQASSPAHPYRVVSTTLSPGMWFSSSFVAFSSKTYWKATLTEPWNRPCQQLPTRKETNGLKQQVSDANRKEVVRGNSSPELGRLRKTSTLKGILKKKVTSSRTTTWSFPGQRFCEPCRTLMNRDRSEINIIDNKMMGIADVYVCKYGLIAFSKLKVKMHRGNNPVRAQSIPLTRPDKCFGWSSDARLGRGQRHSAPC